MGEGAGGLHQRRAGEDPRPREAAASGSSELDEGAPYVIYGIKREPDGRIYYSKRLADENVAKFYVRDSIDGAEEAARRPAAVRRTRRAARVAQLRRAVAGREEGGVRRGAGGVGADDAARARRRPAESSTGETIDRMEVDYTPPYWLPDSSGFVYSRRRELPPTAPPSEGWLQTKSFVHKLGAPAESDAKALAKGLTAAVPMEDVDFPSIVIAEGATHAVGKIKHGDLNELTLYAAPTGDARRRGHAVAEGLRRRRRGDGLRGPRRRRSSW